jgi:protein-disulfide isomerase
LNQSGFCVFDPKGENNEISQINAECGITSKIDKNVTLDNVDLSSFPAKNIGSKDTVILIGCYDCDYSRKAYPDIQKLIAKKKTNYVFAHYPAKEDSEFLSAIDYCVYKEYGDEFWSFNDYLFTADKNLIIDKANTNKILELFNFDADRISKCANSVDTKNAVQKQVNELGKTNLYGTPTVFINGKAFVGPKPYRVYRSAVNDFIFF